MKDTTELCLLVDNGSVRDHAALFTRKLAADLERSCQFPVVATSLAHSDRIPLEKLNGQPVPLLELLLHDLQASDTLKRLRVIPLLMVSEGIIYRKIAAAVAQFALAHPQMEVRMAPALIDPTERDAASVPGLMAAAIVDTVREKGLQGAEVLVVDHGSPVREVAQLRDWVARDVADRLPTGLVARVGPASMERRDGDSYAFADPLLEHALRNAADRGVREVVIAKLFLQPGKHSGKRGDIEGIVQQVMKACPGLQVHPPRQLFRQKDLIYLLKRRLCSLKTG